MIRPTPIDKGKLMSTEVIIVVILLAVTFGGLTWLERHSRKPKPTNNENVAISATSTEQIREVKPDGRNPSRRRRRSIEKMEPRIPVL